MMKQNRYKILRMSNKPVSNGTDVAMLCAEKKTNIQTGILN
jgi:hypothetical protein